MARTIRNNTAESRWEIVEDDVLAGFAEYEDTGELVVFTHTEILPGNEGKGIAGALIKEAMDDIRARETLVLPICPFVQAWIDKHLDYQDLDYRKQPR